MVKASISWVTFMVPSWAAKAAPVRPAMMIPVITAPISRTMAINGEFDLAANPHPPVPQKFSHHDPHHPRALVNTCEEWVLHNCSVSLWAAWVGTDSEAARAAPIAIRSVVSGVAVRCIGARL